VADILDVNENQEVEQNEIEAVEQKKSEQQKPEETKPELPEKYRNKKLEDVVRMHQEAEQLIGKQAQEVGEVRRLADELLKSQLKKEPKEQPKEIDFFENPQEAIKQAVANSPDVVNAKEMVSQMQHVQARQTIVNKHPDCDSIWQDGEFVDWVNSSPKRKKMANEAVNYDVESADELLTTYKQLKEAKQQKVSKAIDETEKMVREKSLQAASVDTGGSGESSKKTYSRVKLLNMQLHRPDEYAELADSGELAKAYREGRVR
jgi:hypothetical protein